MPVELGSFDANKIRGMDWLAIAPRVIAQARARRASEDNIGIVEERGVVCKIFPTCDILVFLSDTNPCIYRKEAKTSYAYCGRFKEGFGHCVDAKRENLDEEQLLCLAAPTAQTMFMANLSSADPVYDEVGPSYDSDTLFEGFSEDVRKLILRIDKVKLYYSVLNLLFDEVESDVNLFMIDSNVETLWSIKAIAHMLSQ
ncbi:hypothetical protein Tco_1541943 [Tanacetum coccineum]